MSIDVQPAERPGKVNVATDEILSVHYPVYKMAYGQTGSITEVSQATPLPVIDPILELSKGNIPGHSSVNKFGRNAALGTGATETVWDGSNLYTFPTTADITHLSQSVDQVAIRGAEIQMEGLDTNYVYTVQTKALDATNTTTLVALDTPLRRVFRIEVNANVVGDQNIVVTNAAGSTTYGQITAGYNQTLMAVYTVPAGKTAYMTEYYLDCNKVSGGGDPELIGVLWTRDNANGYAPKIKHVIGTDSNATSHISHPFKPYLKITEKTDVWINATEVTGGGGVVADVSAGFDLVLVDND